LCFYTGCSKKCRNKNAVCQKTILLRNFLRRIYWIVFVAAIVFKMYVTNLFIANFCWRSDFITASSFFKEYLCWRFYFVVVPTTTTTASTTTSSNSYSCAFHTGCSKKCRNKNDVCQKTTLIRFVFFLFLERFITDNF